ncbi:uncharacterized protein NFIA_063770 [Aspergillus fischeri NRRL 181]|uniref:F-box domain protein n=1 Tax=Neosartorya fischeri (strain ATCC 1020 / DSM 3700 / CBS 544.65 / FGSC A1164 / JCM 1740 / NRRL 181 / WB 181) TaxID=331117 RepID=A1D672_NEOFI|nr:conserved hypothetical protein [Aspergillus fischeri NRRL 181]EAW21216.1 conserved hypothetical protein [Aspergillus fischeri NRRL 181]
MPNPLLLPEIVASVIDNVHLVPDLLNCACVNRMWSVAALKKLYRGSLNDMQFRTPDIGSLNCLFVASRERFARNMSFVKHLLLSPDAIALDQIGRTNIVCHEKCRPLRHRKHAKLLLQPQGSGLTSLVVPYKMKGQDWSTISDLLFTPTIEYLAIDSFYCALVMNGASYSQGSIIPTRVKFSNLKALIIYKPDGGPGIYELCQMLRCCDLQFFHLEETAHSRADRMSRYDLAEVLLCLRQHQNLETLALIVPHCSPPLESTRVEEQVNPWPRLKALYLAERPQEWLELLPTLDELQILNLLDLGPRSSTINQTVLGNIAKCRNLRAIDLNIRDLDNVEALLEIARGCPLLQKFRVKDVRFSGEPCLGEDLFLDLLRALPHLEFLDLDAKFQMDGEKLRELVHHCPRLVVLDLRYTQLHLSLDTMIGLHPFRQLETMMFAHIYFEDLPRLQSDAILTIATLWRRIFPRLRDVRCHSDPPYTMEDDWSEESEADNDGMSDDDDTSLSSISDFVANSDGQKCEQYTLRRKLWRVLGYGKALDINHKIIYMWQTNLEIKTIGWPVVPLAAFSDPEAYSTSTRCGW